MDSTVRELIEKRAYHLFLKRGGIHGYHMQDWVQAEKEIKAEQEAKKKSENKPSIAPQRIEPPKEIKVTPSPSTTAKPAPIPAAPVKSNGKGPKRTR
jgi:hypothetical protein